MPTIAIDELKQIDAVLADVLKIAQTIKQEAPNVSPLCDKIERLGRKAYGVIESVSEIKVP